MTEKEPRGREYNFKGVLRSSHEFFYPSKCLLVLEDFGDHFERVGLVQGGNGFNFFNGPNLIDRVFCISNKLTFLQEFVNLRALDELHSTTFGLWKGFWKKMENPRYWHDHNQGRLLPLRNIAEAIRNSPVSLNDVLILGKIGMFEQDVRLG